MNPFKIGVHLALHGHTQMGTALAALGGHFVGFHHRVEMTQQALQRFQTAFIGAGTAMIGWQGMKGMKHLVDDAGDFLKIQNQMLAGGWRQADLEKAIAQSWQLSAKHRSISAKEILEMQKELAPVLGGSDKALAKAEMMTGFQASMQMPLGTEMAKQFIRQIRDGIKAAELAGEAINTDRFAQYMGSMVKVLNAFGGTITPADYFMATKYARASGLNWSDEYREKILPTIMQELGASSTGTAHMSLYQAIIGGMMRQKSIQHFDELGLIDKSKLNPETDLTKEGRIKRMRPNAFAGTDLLMSNPYEWVHQTLIPAMINKGIITESGMAEIRKGNIKEGEGAETRKEISKYMALLFQNRTAQGLIDMLALQPYKIERDKTWVSGAMGMKDTLPQLDKDYKTAVHALKEQWDNLTTALGLGQIKEATEGLKMLAGGISALTSAVIKDPNIAKALTTSFIALMGAMIVGGIAALGVAIFGATGGLAVIAGAILVGIATYIAARAGEIGKWLESKTLAFGNWFRDMAKSIGTKLGDAILSIPGMVAGAIASMGSAIGNAIKNALGFGKGGESTKGAPSTMDGFQLQNFVPPSRGDRPIQASTQINLDGRVLARAVAHHIAEEGNFVSSGAGFDGHMSPVPVDYVPV